MARCQNEGGKAYMKFCTRATSCEMQSNLRATRKFKFATKIKFASCSQTHKLTNSQLTNLQIWDTLLKLDLTHFIHLDHLISRLYHSKVVLHQLIVFTTSSYIHRRTFSASLLSSASILRRRNPSIPRPSAIAHITSTRADHHGQP